jgi:hypothetical protein
MPAGNSRSTQTERLRDVTVRGRDAAVVVAADELANPLPSASDAAAFVPFMESLSVDGLDLTRDGDVGRDIDL